MNISLASAVLVLFAGSSSAQHAHDATFPRETGQSAFAAIAEIVEILRSDPRTDWSSVDIPALQTHLVDMQVLMTETTATMTKTDQGARFEVTGTPRAIEAVKRMVPSHAPFLDAETGWYTVVELTEASARIEVEGEFEKIAALGFHGLMTIGAHHQQHHLMIATGQDPHR